MTTRQRRAVTVVCVAVSSLIIVAVVAGSIAQHRSVFGALGVCGWPVASIVAGVGYLRRKQ